MDLITLAVAKKYARELVEGVAEILEGTGAEYYTLAPTTLSFRSTAPLDEFQEVQVNGETVSPENYTLEEGSTIVKLSIDYLKTLDAGDYNVAVVSQTKTANGNFTVAAPELNNHGFYYNQPYMGYVSELGDYISLFYYEDGRLDAVYVNSGQVETGNFTSSNDGIVAFDGAFNLTVSAVGTKMYCHELNVTLTLSDLFVADKDYIYCRTTYGDTDCYMVNAVINRYNDSYPPFRSGINGLPTMELAVGLFENNPNLTSIVIPDDIVSISGSAFSGCMNLISINMPKSLRVIGTDAFANCKKLSSITLPSSVTNIGYFAFGNCISLTNIEFEGTVEQWNSITLQDGDVSKWNYAVPATHVQCSDGTVAL